MSSSIPMYALDKVKTSLLIPAEVVVKLSSLAKEKGKSLTSYINIALFALVHEMPWTEEDERARQKIIADNKRKRQALKEKKGIK